MPAGGSAATAIAGEQAAAAGWLGLGSGEGLLCLRGHARAAETWADRACLTPCCLPACLPADTPAAPIAPLPADASPLAPCLPSRPICPPQPEDVV